MSHDLYVQCKDSQAPYLSSNVLHVAAHLLFLSTSKKKRLFVQLLQGKAAFPRAIHLCLRKAPQPHYAKLH